MIFVTGLTAIIPGMHRYILYPFVVTFQARVLDVVFVGGVATELVAGLHLLIPLRLQTFQGVNGSLTQLVVGGARHQTLPWIISFSWQVALALDRVQISGSDLVVSEVAHDQLELCLVQDASLLLGVFILLALVEAAGI